MQKIFIDPPSKAFYENRFFSGSELNRDDCLRSYISLKEELSQQNIKMNTFDLWDPSDEDLIEYYSFGILDNYEKLHNNKKVILKAFYIFEPPVVAPSIYRALPKLTSIFESVFIHNTHGNGYSLKEVDQSKLKKLFWPQPYDHVLKKHWANKTRQPRIVVINGNHKPVSKHRELYSKRIEAMTALARHDVIDLYGRGWDRWFSRSSLWMPYWKNRKTIMSIYKGSCESKYEILSQYDFCLCFENMVMDGYMTEKMFDCLYAGTVPIYWGAPDVANYVSSDAYIDASVFDSWCDLKGYLESLSSADIQLKKEAGRAYIESGDMKLFYDALLHVMKPEDV